jgi:RimJ/RimL family protein N-acetyltransferase
MKSLVFKTFPIIEFDDIILREISSQDTYEFFKYINNPNVKEFLSEEDSPRTSEAAREELMYWTKLFFYKHSIYWGIASKRTNKLIGTCGFNNWHMTHNRAEISYDLAYEHWGKGIMTRSIDKICQFAFDKMLVNRIQATVATENKASIKILDKLGFCQEARLKDYGVLHDNNKDFYMYALTRRNNKG